MQNGLVHRKQVQSAQPLNESELCLMLLNYVNFQNMQESFKQR